VWVCEGMCYIERVFMNSLDERIKYNNITFALIVVLSYAMIRLELTFIIIFSYTRLQLTFYRFPDADNVLSDIKLLFDIMICIYIMK